MKNNLNIQQKIQMAHMAIQRINQGYIERRYGEPCPPPYLFSTENLTDSYKFLDFQDKNVLTIGGSGDHAIEAYARGARHVTQIDRNILQESVTRLKFELIKRMTYSQFMHYFFGTLMSLKTNESYQIIKPFIPCLSTLAQQFLHSYYTSTNQYFFLYFEPFYDIDFYKTDKISYIKSESNYNAAKNKLPADIEFVIEDLQNVPAKIQQKYDVIHLSNVLTAGWGTEKEKSYYDKAFKNLYENVAFPIIQNNLTPKGQMVFGYLWGVDMTNNDINTLIINKFKNIKLSDARLEIQHFESVKKVLKKDAILTIQKNR